MSKNSGLVQSIKNLITEITTYWKKPKEGEYVSYKEFSYFVLGVSGNNSYTSFAGYLTFAAGCFLVGSIYGISFSDIFLIGLMGLPLSYLMTPINMLITDNLGDVPKKSARFINIVSIPLLIIGFACYFIPQRFTESIMPALPQILGTILTTSALNVYFRIFVLKKLSKSFGKFRSWIIAGAVPSMIFFFLIVFIPFEKDIMPYYTKLWVLHLLFSLFNIFNVFSGQVGNLQNIISPSTEERTKIISFGSFLFSLLPSIVSILLPVLATLAGGFNNITVYRTVFPIGMSIFAAMTMILAFKVTDRVIIEKSHKPQISFIKGSKAVMKNKYFWITNLSGAFNFLTGGSVAVLNIFFIYVSRQDWLMGIYAAIVGTSCIPGMLFAPFLIKKLGKRNLMLLQKLVNILSLGGSLLAIMSGSVVLFIAVNFVCTLMGSPTNIASQAMTPDMWDYQQYLTGERLDGFSGIFNYILSPLTTLAGYLIPFVYAIYGFTTDWDIMYIPGVRNQIVLVTAIVGWTANIFAAIPFLFYDLTEKKHKHIMDILKERAGKQSEETEVAVVTEENLTF